MDEDSDGKVTWAEIQRLLRNFNISESNPVLLQLFRVADTDSDGSIDYQEFQRYFGELIHPNTGGGYENDIIRGAENMASITCKNQILKAYARSTT